ncbi:hypothetical protein H8356DRAFT_1740669 [Neocallimastix lanati (nom. inval.)]|nr:hypothetical protein H8356DRAFT_1740669 [Neocallimastix sp. JGI-2020a]
MCVYILIYIYILLLLLFIYIYCIDYSFYGLYLLFKLLFCLNKFYLFFLSLNHCINSLYICIKFLYISPNKKVQFFFIIIYCIILLQ